MKKKLSRLFLLIFVISISITLFGACKKEKAPEGPPVISDEPGEVIDSGEPEDSPDEEMPIEEGEDDGKME